MRGIKRVSWNTCFISEFRQWHFDKIGFKLFKVLNFSALFSAIVQILRTKKTWIFCLQWFGSLDVNGRGFCAFVSLWQWSIQIPLSLYFIKLSKNIMQSLLYSMVNCIEGLIELKVSNIFKRNLWKYITNGKQCSEIYVPAYHILLDWRSWTTGPKAAQNVCMQDLTKILFINVQNSFYETIIRNSIISFIAKLKAHQWMQPLHYSRSEFLDPIYATLSMDTLKSDVTVIHFSIWRQFSWIYEGNLKPFFGWRLCSYKELRN